MSGRSILLFLLCMILLIFVLSIYIPTLNMIISNIELTVSGILRVTGSPPQVIEIYVNESRCEETPPGPQVDGLAGNRVQLRFNATIFNINGNCNYNTYVYMCKNTTGLPCTSDRYDYYSHMTLFQRDTYRCNFTDDNTLPLDYFERYGNWYVNVTATDSTNPSFTNNTQRFWKYNIMGVYLYPVSGVGGNDVIDIGDITLDSWNTGGANATRNIGNIRLNMSWNVSDFICTDATCPGPNNVIDIDGTNFCMDNDTDRTNGCGYINTDPTIKIDYYPSGGMRRCGNLACSQDEELRGGDLNLANYTLWWHINTTSPKDPGIYRNGIDPTSSYNYEG